MSFREIGVCPLFLIAALTAGCASLSGKECRSGDWSAIGREDGERGDKASEIERHREACTRHGVTPDEARWREGYAVGLARYCTPRGGYVAGRDGGGDSSVCPPALAGGFQQGLRHGREVNNLLRDLKELRQRRDELQAAAMSGDDSAEDRTQMRFRAGELNDRVRMREWDLERLDRKYAREHGAPELDVQDLRW